MTTIDEALDTITKTVRQNEPGELAREIRLLRAEIARLSGEVAAIKSRPQVIPQPYPVYPPVYPPYYPTPWLPSQHPGFWHITSGAPSTARSDHFATITGPTIVALTNPVTISARDVEGFRDAAQFVQNLTSAIDSRSRLGTVRTTST